MTRCPYAWPSMQLEVTLYLYESWALALSGFAGKVLAGDGLSSELKGALVEVQELS